MMQRQLICSDATRDELAETLAVTKNENGTKTGTGTHKEKSSSSSSNTDFLRCAAGAARYVGGGAALLLPAPPTPPTPGWRGLMGSMLRSPRMSSAWGEKTRSIGA